MNRYNLNGTLSDFFSVSSKNTLFFLLLKQVSLVLFGTTALWVSAKVQIPFYPVELTFQTFILLLIGMCYGWRLGLATILLYYIQGLTGLPVFAGSPAKGIGWAYMAGPTGGYLVGFLLCVLFVGFFAYKRFYRKYISTLFILIGGNFIIYIPGLIWLAQFTGWDKVLAFGLYPFVLGDLLKIFMATLLVPSLWKLVLKWK